MNSSFRMKLLYPGPTDETFIGTASICFPGQLADDGHSEAQCLVLICFLVVPVMKWIASHGMFGHDLSFVGPFGVTCHAKCSSLGL